MFRPIQLQPIRTGIYRNKLKKSWLKKQKKQIVLQKLHDLPRRKKKNGKNRQLHKRNGRKERKEQTKDQVNRKIQSYLQQFAEETKSSLAADWRDQEQLKHTKKRIDEALKDLASKKSELEEHIVTVDKKTKEIEDWLEESKTAKEVEPSIDDVCQPVNKLHAQMLDLSAENAALTDVMYFLDRGMYSGQIDCSTHLKTIRKLAKRQFLIRAHLIKINQVLAKSS